MKPIIVVSLLLVMLLTAACPPEVIIRNGREIPVPDCNPSVEYTGTKFNVKGASIVVPNVGEVLKIGEATWEREVLQKASTLTQILDNHRVGLCQALKTAIGASESVFDQFLIDFQREEHRLTQLAVLISANKPDAVIKWIEAYEPFAAGFQPERAALLPLDALIKHTTRRVDELELLGDARSSLNDGFYTEAINKANKVLESNPQNARAYQIRGSANYKLKNYSPAFNDFKRASDIDQNNYNYPYNAGSCLSILGDHTTAIEYYNRALNLNPTYAYAHFGLGYSYQKMRKYDEALREFSIALEANSEIAEIAEFNMAEVYSLKIDSEGLKKDYVDRGILMLRDSIRRGGEVRKQKVFASNDLKALRQTSEFTDLMKERS